MRGVVRHMRITKPKQKLRNKGSMRITRPRQKLKNPARRTLIMGVRNMRITRPKQKPKTLHQLGALFLNIWIAAPYALNPARRMLEANM